MIYQDSKQFYFVMNLKVNTSYYFNSSKLIMNIMLLCKLYCKVKYWSKNKLNDVFRSKCSMISDDDDHGN